MAVSTDRVKNEPEQFFKELQVIKDTWYCVSWAFPSKAFI